MRTRTILAVASALLLAGSLRAQTAEPTPSPKPPPKAAKTPGASKKPVAPLDFTGVWEIDVKASRGVSKNMEHAVISVRQNGDRIWLEPLEQKTQQWLAADEIVVDGRLYEKALGGGRKGTVQAEWGKDKTSLWIQSTTGTDPNPKTAMQRSVWRLREDGKVWTRQSWTVEKTGKRETFLVFRKREAAKKP